MDRIRTLSLPLITGVLVGLPVFWAYPEALSPWRSIGIIAGWIGCGLLLATLLSMVREPRLAAGLGGLERMYGWHHQLGTVSYLILLAHPLALALDARDDSPAMAWSLLGPTHQSWPVWLGWTSLIGLMAGLALAFARQLSYGTWRWLHFLLAAAVVCALAHLLLLGLDELLLWVPLLALGLMLWRGLRADLGLGAQPYVVAAVEHPADHMVEISLLPLEQPLLAQPGQFVLAAFFDGPQFHGCSEYHPFTISGVGPEGRLALGIKALGDCTRHLQDVEPGVAVRVQGAFGTFFADVAAGPALWIAGGVGITPFLAVLRRQPPVHPVRLIYLHRDGADGAYRQELLALAAAHPHVELVEYATGDGQPELDKIIPAVADLAGRECYLCGPPGLVAAAIGVLRMRGVPPSRIHSERFEFR
jgi:predicted ferric reductase